MIERTALEIADSLEVEMLSLKNADAAAEMLRSQAAEIERLTSCLFEMQNAAKSLAAERDAAIAAAVAAERAEIERLKRERHHIYDLLARIHRDGGQYTADHGVEKSCDDAEAQVVTWLDTLSSVDALIEQARIAEREACAKTCEREAVLYDIRGAYKTGNHCAEEIRARGKS